jgi:hypothetical protein
MLGVIASMLTVTGGQVDESVPANVVLDFTTGSYSIGGVTQTITDLLGTTWTMAAGGAYGGVFDPSYISASGMLIPNSTGEDPPYGNRPEAIGPLLAAFDAMFNDGGTMVLELSSADFASTFGITRFFAMKDGGYFTSVTDGLFVEGTTGPNTIYAAPRGGGSDDMESTNEAASGIQRIAITLNRVAGADREHALSVNGEAAIVVPEAFYSGTSIAHVMLGTWVYETADEIGSYYIRSLVIYPALDPADLPALSAL